MWHASRIPLGDLDLPQGQAIAGRPCANDADHPSAFPLLSGERRIVFPSIVTTSSAAAIRSACIYSTNRSLKAAGVISAKTRAKVS